MFVTNSLSRRTVLQINLRQLHSVPCATRYASLPGSHKLASKQRSVPWCCRCGMFAAFTTAAIRLLRSIFIWAPPRTRPKFQHLCERRKIFQPVSRMIILEIHNAVVAVPADVTSLGCHCLQTCSMLLTVFWYISYDDDESVVLSRSWPLPSQQRLAEMSSYRLTRLDRRVLGWHRSKYRWWCLPPSNDTFSSKQLANQLLPDSVRFSVCKKYFGANSELPGTNERMCRRIWSSKTSALARIPSTYIPKYFMRHVCAPKFCLLLTAVMSNDVGAAAEYLSTPRPIIGWHHLLLLHLKTECNTCEIEHELMHPR